MVCFCCFQCVESGSMWITSVASWMEVVVETLGEEHPKSTILCLAPLQSATHATCITQSHGWAVLWKQNFRTEEQCRVSVYLTYPVLLFFHSKLHILDCFPFLIPPLQRPFDDLFVKPYYSVLIFAISMWNLERWGRVCRMQYNSIQEVCGITLMQILIAYIHEREIQ